MASLILDTGFLVALGRQKDPLHESARNCFLQETGPLITVSAVIIETCFFLDSPGKIKLLKLAASPRLRTLELPVSAYEEISETLSKYKDHEIDFADASLIWLANRTGVRRILTTDNKDFSIFRLARGKCFEIVKWVE